MEQLADKVAAFPAEVADWQVADTLNTPAAEYGTKRCDVATADIQTLLLIKGAWAKIVLGCEVTSGLSLDVRALLITVRDALVNRQVVKATDPEVYASVQGMTASLTAAAIIDQDTANRLMALAETPASWADLNFSGNVTSRDVGLARGGVA